MKWIEIVEINNKHAEALNNRIDWHVALWKAQEMYKKACDYEQMLARKLAEKAREYAKN